MRISLLPSRLTRLASCGGLGGARSVSAAALFGALVLTQSCTPPSPVSSDVAPLGATSTAATSATAPTPGVLVDDPRAQTDYLILAPKDFVPALAPLVQHRESLGHVVHTWVVEDVYARFSEGRPDPRALYAAVRELWTVSHGRLRFLLLVGDIRRPDEQSVHRLPAVYLPKLRYNTHDHTVLHYRSRSLPQSHHCSHEAFPSDHPYTVMEGEERDGVAKATGTGAASSEPSAHTGGGHEGAAEPNLGDPSDTLVHPDGRSRYARDADRASLPWVMAADGRGAPPPLTGRSSLAAGRLPARDAGEVADFVAKLIAYETGPVGGLWPRRLMVMAGPARYSRFVDAMIEASALTLLEQQVPYDYDLSLVFAKASSSYAYRFDRLSDKLVEEANRGALIMAYVGHSSPAYFDSVPYRGDYYPIGSRRDFERMSISRGGPLFISLSCSAGGFDLSNGWRSMAEAAVMNPQGAIASFAASRESHPYGNLLYGEALVAQFIRGRPRTLGEGLLEVKRELRERSSLVGEQMTKVDTGALKEEHARLYNLLGDPATRLRYPKPLSLRLTPAAADTVAPGGEITIEFECELDRALGWITIETRRNVIRGSVVPAAALAKLPMPKAFEQMEDNHRQAIDKVVVSVERSLTKGPAQVRLTAPREPGEYVVKVLIRPLVDAPEQDQNVDVAAGHGWLTVAEPAR